MQISARIASLLFIVALSGISTARSDVQGAATETLGEELKDLKNSSAGTRLKAAQSIGAKIAKLEPRSESKSRDALAPEDLVPILLAHLATEADSQVHMHCIIALTTATPHVDDPEHAERLTAAATNWMFSDPNRTIRISGSLILYGVRMNIVKQSTRVDAIKKLFQKLNTETDGLARNRIAFALARHGHWRDVLPALKTTLLEGPGDRQQFGVAIKEAAEKLLRAEDVKNETAATAQAIEILSDASKTVQSELPKDITLHADLDRYLLFGRASRPQMGTMVDLVSGIVHSFNYSMPRVSSVGITGEVRTRSSGLLFSQVSMAPRGCAAHDTPYACA